MGNSIARKVVGSDNVEYRLGYYITPHSNETKTLTYILSNADYRGTMSIKIMPPYNYQMYVDALAERIQTKIEDVKDSFGQTKKEIL